MNMAAIAGLSYGLRLLEQRERAACLDLIYRPSRCQEIGELIKGSAKTLLNLGFGPLIGSR